MAKFKIVPKIDQVAKTLRLDEKKWSQLEQLAADHKMSVNSLINQMIDYALDNMDKPKKEE